MASEGIVNFIADLVITDPADSEKISALGQLGRNVRRAIKGSFPNLGSTAVTVTAEHLNATVSTLEDSVVAGSITFADANHGLKWDLSGGTPAWATPLSFTAFTEADPYVPGNPTIAGLSLNAPVAQINNPVLPGVTSGWHIYYRSDDAAPVSGFEFIDEVDDSQSGGFSVFNDTGSIGMLLRNNTGGNLYLSDLLAADGALVSLSDILGTASIATILSTYGSILQYIQSLETRIAALE